MHRTSSDDDPNVYIAVYDYAGRNDNEMSFMKGDRLRIISKENEFWWEAESLRLGVTGWIPSNYVAPPLGVQKFAWYHGPISRTSAEFLLNNGVDGTFLVRESESSPGEYSISLRCDCKVFHYRVSKSAMGLFVSKEFVFPTLKELVEHHSKSAHGLITCLKHPLAKKEAVVYGAPSAPSDKWEMDRSEIQLGRKLGAGQYGEVFEGLWRSKNLKVAVKTFKTDTMNSEDFLKEASVMKLVRHPNLVQLLGVCTRDEPMFIITEYMPGGNLLDYLRQHSTAPERLNATSLMYIATQIASGMAYLESHSYIHRDLAARNCLVGADLLIKIADFGLSRLLKQVDCYTAREGSKFPIKWTAPESLSFNRFTSKSDVWAFGVVLWEIATYGDAPYPDIDLYDVLERLESGYRMKRPAGCPAHMYQLMRDCWEWDELKRPSFKNIKERLDNMFSSVEEEVKKVLSIEKGAGLQDMAEFERSLAAKGGAASAPSQPAAHAQPASGASASGPPNFPAPAAPTASSPTKQPQPQPAPRPQPQPVRPAPERPTPMPRVARDTSRDLVELVDMTQLIFKKAHHIIHNSTPNDLEEALNLLIADTEQMIQSCMTAPGAKEGALQQCQILQGRLAAIDPANAQHSPDIRKDVQLVAKGVKELFDAVKAGL
eukprot:m.165293 g.165293  ORF g.165293 m.165293 type:complete len:658 (+) comp17152_c0_seq2:358-2331(+)